MRKMVGILAGLSLAALWLYNPKPKDEDENEKEKEVPEFYDHFVQALNDNGIEVLKTRQMAANLVGALDGIKLSTLAGDIEIYHFTKDNLALKKAKALGKFSADGSRFYDVVVNDTYLLWVSSLPQNIIDIFLATQTDIA